MSRNSNNNPPPQHGHKIPAGPIAEHIRGLLALGATNTDIALAAGLGVSTVTQVKRHETVRQDVADAILALNKNTMPAIRDRAGRIFDEAVLQGILNGKKYKFPPNSGVKKEYVYALHDDHGWDAKRIADAMLMSWGDVRNVLAGTDTTSGVRRREESESVGNWKHAAISAQKREEQWKSVAERSQRILNAAMDLVEAGGDTVDTELLKKVLRSE